MEGKVNFNRYKIILVVTIIIFLLSQNANGIMLRGYFPHYQGRFWNFVQSKDNGISTWAINGTLTLRDVGSVFVLVQDDGKFLCMREDWKGLYVYGEYGPDKYYIPDEPLLFLPSTLEPGVIVRTSVGLKVFSDPEGGVNFEERGRVNRETTFRLKGIEDIEIGSRKFRECVVVEKTTNEQNSIASEIIWLAPLIGPVKRVIRRGNESITYTIMSYSRSGIQQNQIFSIKDFYPLKPGITWKYQGHDKEIWSITARKNERVNGVVTTPLAEEGGDIYYHAIDSNGFILLQKFWSSVAGCAVFHPPEPPLVVFPATLELGSYYLSISTPRIHTWPSMTLFDGFLAESQYSSIPVCLENVDTPSGIYKECLKVCLYSISKNFSVKNEKIRVGYMWLAKDTGPVKVASMDITNYFHPKRTNRINDIRFWELMNQIE
jgi:hypothetical protein